MHKNNGKRDHELEREQGGVCAKFRREEREGGDDTIILQSQIKEKVKNPNTLDSTTKRVTLV